MSTENLELLSGKDALSVYQFGTKKAKHYFCTTCGIHPFSNPRAAPEMYAVNIRCLDRFHELIDGISVAKFDGQNWEQAVKDVNFVR